MRDGINDNIILIEHDTNKTDHIQDIDSRIENFKGQINCLLKLMYEHVGFSYSITTTL